MEKAIWTPVPSCHLVLQLGRRLLGQQPGVQRVVPVPGAVPGAAHGKEVI